MSADKSQPIANPDDYPACKCRKFITGINIKNRMGGISWVSTMEWYRLVNEDINCGQADWILLHASSTRSRKHNSRFYAV